jgi:hypothetical protein
MGGERFDRSMPAEHMLLKNLWLCGTLRAATNQGSMLWSQFSAIFANFRRFLPIFGDFCQFSAIFANFRRFLPIFGENIGVFLKNQC